MPSARRHPDRVRPGRPLPAAPTRNLLPSDTHCAMQTREGEGRGTDGSGRSDEPEKATFECSALIRGAPPVATDLKVPGSENKPVLPVPSSRWKQGNTKWDPVSGKPSLRLSASRSTV